MIFSLDLVDTDTYVNERINDMSAGHFVAGLKYSENVFFGINFICMAWRNFTINYKSSDQIAIV